MSDWYYVSYQIGSGGQMTGFGSIEMQLDHLPRVGTDDVIKLSREITEASYERGTLPRGYGVVVTGWSRMAA